MKLLFLHPNSWTGEYALLEQLAAWGEDVCVLEERRGLGAARRNADFFRKQDDRIRTLWYDPSRGAERLLTWIADRRDRRAFDGRNLHHRMRVIAEAIRHFDPDVVLCSDGFSYAVPAAMLRERGGFRQPLMVSFIGGDLIDAPEADTGRRRTPEMQRFLRTVVAQANLLRPVSPLLKPLLLELGADPARIEVLPSHLTASREVLDAVRSRKSSVRAELCARHGIPDDAPLLVTLGTNYKWKGMQVFAAAWPSIRAAFPKAHWLLAGPSDPWLARGVWPLLPDRAGVIATGSLAQQQAYEHLVAADLDIAPSLAEGLNMVVVEAAALGTPSIVGSGAGISAWVDRLGFGAVVPSGDADALGRMIRETLGDPARLAKWRSACPTVAAEFSLEVIADKVRSLATRLVK